MPDFSAQPKVLSDAEIEVLLQGDRRQIDKLLLTQVSGLSSAFIEFKFYDFPQHAAHEEKLHKSMAEIIEELGTKEEVRARVAFIDSAIAESKARTKMYEDIRTDIAKHTVKGLLLALIGLVTFWWYHHKP